MHWITLVAALCINISVMAMLVLALIDARTYTNDRNVCGWTAVFVMALTGVTIVLALLQSLKIIVW